eukprot:TRINITY_DN10482_c0_g1_i1.p1 TRINITY_DN10482_c0_g1~~TRINITY_DN10482_c0_g1_i1.p1  ORF type:complete len:105 (+),score=23.33 TRINITY_DN10482_c0_g1_i1:100-414(+)
MIRRPPRSTQSRSSAASDVYKRQCHTCRLRPVGTGQGSLRRLSMSTTRTKGACLNSNTRHSRTELSPNCTVTLIALELSPSISDHELRLGLDHSVLVPDYLRYS